MATIEVLNDDCLMHVLGMLNPKERLLLERVSKRWQNVLQSLWRKQRTLSLDTWDHITVIPLQGLRSILNKCGYYLYELDVSAKSECLNFRTLPLVACKCPNLRILNISDLNITPHGASVLGNNCTKLKELNVRRCPNLKDSYLKCIFEKNIDLEVVDLCGNIDINGQCIMYLGPNVKKLSLSSCKNICEIPHLKRFEKLVSLTLAQCHSLRSNDIKEIFEAVPQLQNLLIASYSGHNERVNPMLHLNVLHDLQLLNLYANDCISDDILSVISLNCKQLRTLDISYCESGITDRGLISLASLPNLQNLYMKGQSSITDHSLKSIAKVGKLIDLDCTHCVALSGRGFKTVMKHCKKLKKLNVMNISLASEEEIMKFAIEHVKNRDLKLVFYYMERIPINVPPNILIKIAGINLVMDDIYERSAEDSDFH